MGAKVSDVVKQLQKDHGEKIVSKAVDCVDFERVPSGIYPVSMGLGGGFPKGKMSMIFGPESCLDGETHIPYEVWTKSGFRQNHKGGTLSRLYDRFHGVKRTDQGNYQKKQSEDSLFYVKSINDFGAIEKNLVLDVVHTGLKRCYTLETTTGDKVTATGDHKFFTGHGYVKLDSLIPGGIVFLHNNTRYTQDHRIRRYNCDYVKYHPKGTAVLREGGYKYYQLHRCRLVVEASLNSMTFKQYKDFLNSQSESAISTLIFIPEGFHVHHVDENTLNDSPNNLVLLKSEAHNKEHAFKNHNKLRFIAVPVVIKSIYVAGVRDTYDITCPRPMNNYVANKFIVHNSCKTTIALIQVGAYQLMCPAEVCVWIDCEWAFDKVWAKKLGVNLDTLLVVKPETAEQAAETAEGLSQAEDVGFVVLDSIAAMMPAHEVEIDFNKALVGGNSVIVQRMVRKINNGLIKSAKEGFFPTFLFLNQLRSKIGVLYGSPDKFPGGRALGHYCNIILRSYAKDTVETKIHKDIPAWKEITLTVKKNKIPIVSTTFGFKMLLIPHSGMAIGHIDYKNQLINHAKEFGYVANTGGKWQFNGQDFKTLLSVADYIYSLPEVRVDLEQALSAEALSKIDDCVLHE